MTEIAQLAQDLIGPAAIFPLTNRAFLRITGPDATRWLNGMVTNNIKDLAPGQGNYNFLLNAQGRIQGDCTIYREPGEGEPTFLLETDKSQIETIHSLLDKFIIMDDVELSPGIRLNGELTDSPLGIGVLGPKAEDILASVMMTVDEFPLTEPFLGKNITRSTHNGKYPSWVLNPPNFSLPYFEIWCSNPTDYEYVTGWIDRSEPVRLREETIESLRILEARPKYGIDIRNTETNKDLPQETAQTHALNFNKGCYLGQEIVERIHSRGQVHRTFTQFTLTGELPTLPAPLTAGEKPAGELTSTARIGDQIIALGYIRREFATQTLTYLGGEATVRNPPKP